MIWHDSEIKDDGAAVFNIQDRVRLGDGVFDTLLVIDGQPLYRDQHLKRLQDNLNVLGIKTSISASRINNFIQNTTGKYALNIIISRGESERGIATPQHSNSTFVMKLSPVPSDFLPLHAIIAQSTRRNEHSPLSRIKSFNYGDNVLAMREAESQNANEAIMMNTRGDVSCFCAGNLIANINGEYVTPPLTDGVLDGVMRGIVIDRLKVSERSLTPNDILGAQSLYMTNSIRGIVPVIQLDGRDINSPALVELNNTILNL